MAQITVKLSDIPNESDIEFRDTDYFKSWKALPTPSEVRAQALYQHKAGIVTDSRRTYFPEGPHSDPPPVLFRERNLWVKWGLGVRLSEAQSLYIVRKFLPDGFPAPEIYGWRKDGEDVFLYCELLQGQTLQQKWYTMGEDARISVTCELRVAVENLRRLQQDSQEQFVGRLVGTPWLTGVGALLGRFGVWLGARVTNFSFIGSCNRSSSLTDVSVNIAYKQDLLNR